MRRSSTSRNNVQQPPSLPGGLVGGNLRQFWRDRTGFLQELSRLGDVTYFRPGNQNGYFLNHPELIRDLFVVNAQKFRKGRALQRARVLLGNGLLSSEGIDHLRQRRMIQPAFHRQRIAEYSRSMVNYAERMSSDWVDGEVLDVDKEMMTLTLHIVAKTLFNAEVGGDSDEIGKAMTTVVSTFNFLMLPFSEWLERLPVPHTIRLRRAQQTLDNVIYRIIQSRRTSGDNPGDLLSMLLAAQDEEDGKGMSDQQVRDECLTLFLAGHETTANALIWTWYLLSENPAAEANLHKELDDVLSGKSPDFEDIPKLKFTESVIAESMRLYPPAWAIGRSAIEPHSFGGYEVRPRSLVLTSPFVTHRDPRYWNEPEAFQPERWEKMSIKEAGQRYIYFPFGGGARRCVGESFAWTEAILLLATLAGKWKLRLVSDQKIGLNPQITLRPKYGMRMQIQAR
jgi:cytochrome P450